MAQKSIEKRIATLESQMEEIRDQLAGGNGTRDWRRSIGAFTDDDDMLQLLRDAMKLREADRKAATKKKPKTNR
jgi:hypothetical protein